MIGANLRPQCTPGGFCNPTNRKKQTGTIHIRQAAREALIRRGALNMPKDGFTFGSQEKHLP